jgi:excisionase family DNA binding protein
MRPAVWALAVSDEQGHDALDALFAGRPETLSVEEVAELFNISKQNAYAWLREGVIPGYKLGTTWRVIRDELKETMRRGANAPRDRSGHPPHEDDEES